MDVSFIPVHVRNRCNTVSRIGAEPVVVIHFAIVRTATAEREFEYEVASQAVFPIVRL